MNLWPSRDILDALGWTLLHFLWQGLVIAALFAIALRFLRRRSANLRYLAGCLALLLMVVAPVVTFYSLTRSGHTSPALQFTETISTDVAPEQPALPPSVPRIISAPAPAPVPHVYKPDFSERLEAALPWLVVVWLLGVLTLSCRLFAGWWVIQLLKRHATTRLAASWQPRLQELARRVGVSRPVRLLQSACVEVPAVIGWLRPVILLPVTCLTGLTDAQLESILAHELAHIRRHDYLVNILQNLVETLLFYHPAVWWVSRRIRQEREHCCDDLAVKICGDPATYARALATLEELRPAPAPFALAAAGAPLLERIRRLAGQPERSPVRPAWPVAGIIALLLLALVVAGLRNNPASAQSAAATAATNQSENISVQTNIPTGTGATSLIIRKDNSTGQIVDFSNPPAAQPAPASSTTNQIANPPVSTALASHTNKSPGPAINIKMKFAEVDESKAGTNAFASLFKQGEMDSLTNLPATFQFSEFLIVKPTNSGAEDRLVYLHAESAPASLSGRLSGVQYQSIINTLEERHGVDVLTTPELTMRSGQRGEVQVGETLTLVVGRPDNTNDAILTNWLFGPKVDVVPRLAADGHTIELKMEGTINEFVGYEDPAGVTNSDGKPMPKYWGIPRIRRRQFSANVAIADGQTLVLGGLPTALTLIEKPEPKSSFFGRLFQSRKTTTNTVHKSLLLFISPKLVTPKGAPYRSIRAIDHPDGTSEVRRTGIADDTDDIVFPNQAAQILGAKLYTIRLPKVEYDNLPLSEVINHLSNVSKSVDPDKTGINFFITPNVLQADGNLGGFDPATGLPLASPPTDMNSVTVTIEPGLTDVRLYDVLDAITKSTSKPIKYSILGYAVVFSPRGPDAPPPLEIRTFHVDPDAFFQKLGIELTNDARTGLRIPSADGNHFHAAVAGFFNSVGADFNANDPAKTFTYSSRHSVLMVRATHEELEKIAAALPLINPPPNVTKASIADHVQQGEILYQAGNLTEAAAMFKKVSDEDPGNAAAFQYLQLIKEKRAEEATRLSELNPGSAARPVPNDWNGKLEPRTNPFDRNRTNLVYTSKSRQAILDKLDSIRVPEVQYLNLPLSDVIGHLARLSKSLDPKKAGINFFIGQPLETGSIDPATGLPVALPAGKTPADLGSVGITITPALKNVRLADVLDAITKTADSPIKYSILDYAIEFSFRDTNAVSLEIRTFHIDPTTFNQALESTGGPPPGSVTNLSNNQLQPSVREFFNAVGVDFRTNNPANVGKAFAWSDRKGVLTVRAPAQDLDMIAAVVETINEETPQISFKVKYVLRDVGTNSPMVGFIPLDSNGIPTGPLTNARPVVTPPNTPPLRVTFSGFSFSGILSPSQYQAALKATEDKNEHLLDAQEVTTISGRQAQINLVDASNQPPSTGTPHIQNPVIGVLPRISDDMTSIQLTVFPYVLDFIGYAGPGQMTTDMEGKPLLGHASAPTMGQAYKDVTVSDGDTYMFNFILSVAPSSNGKSPGKTNSASARPQKELLIFLTPTIINPDGTPFHTEEQRAFFQSARPALSPPK